MHRVHAATDGSSGARPDAALETAPPPIRAPRARNGGGRLPLRRSAHPVHGQLWLRIAGASVAASFPARSSAAASPPRSLGPNRIPGVEAGNASDGGVGSSPAADRRPAPASTRPERCRSAEDPFGCAERVPRSAEPEAPDGCPQASVRRAVRAKGRATAPGDRTPAWPRRRGRPSRSPSRSA